ncbi:SDR family NAD(P)-dependent oxidoreductase, partial [Phytoactinopolyspora alkaliphila]|uniref:SDR family NAD(P)-dependent oxidoreductase n=1 Tax=Phytoactinopolyspora alkaliphila TaxID=1783498 RepID=UPI003CCCC029
MTGAGGGLGRAMAHRLLADGYVCVLAGRSVAALKATVESAGVGGDRAVVVECDIRSAQDRDRLIDTAAEHGQLFALVNNAGIARM